MKILIVKYGALGDVVRTSYILRGIVEKYSNVSITWLTSKVAKDLLRFNHNIDNILSGERDGSLTPDNEPDDIIDKDIIDKDNIIIDNDETNLNPDEKDNSNA